MSADGVHRDPLHRFLWFLVDYVAPVAFGIIVAAASWTIFSDQCRGWSYWDPSQHLIFARHVFFESGSAGVRGSPYGPLVYLWTNLFFDVFSPDRRTAELSIVLFYLPLALCSYHLGRGQAGRCAGLLSMVLICLNQPVLECGHEYLLDLPLLTAVTAMLVVFQHTDWFQRQRASILLAVVLAAGMLIKRNFFFFFWPPVLAWMILVVRSSRSALVPVTMFLCGGALVWFVLAGALPVDEEVFLRYWVLHLLMIALVGLMLHRGLGLLERSRFGPRLFRSAEAFQQMRNGSVCLALAAGWVTPWFIIHRIAQLDHFRMNQEQVLSFGAAASMLAEDVAAGWLGAPLMLAAGISLLMLTRGRQRPLLALAGLLVASLFLVSTCEPRPRFLVPLLPFTVILATWYLPRLGRLRSWAALFVLAIQIPFIFQPTKNHYERPLITSKITIPNSKWADAYGDDRRRTERCIVAIRLEALADALRSEGPLPEIAVLVDDQAHLDRLDRHELVVGLSSRILGSTLEPSRRQMAILFLSEIPDCEQAATDVAPRETRRTLLLYPGHGRTPLEPIIAALSCAGYRPVGAGFSPLSGEMGLHVIRTELRGGSGPPSDRSAAGAGPLPDRDPPGDPGPPG